MPDIYAAGFNAHNQLNLATVGNNEDAPEDIRTLTKITEEANGSAKVLFAGWSSTVLLLNNTLRISGHFPASNTTQRELTLPHNDISDPSTIRSVFGDANSPLGLLTLTGILYSFAVLGDQLFLVRQGDEGSPKLAHVAMTNTGRTSIVFLQASGSKMIHVLEFESWGAFEVWFADPSSSSKEDKDGTGTDEKTHTHHMLPGRAATLLAGATCFILLTEEGGVFSWGDGRHSRCLGRTPDSKCPSNEPYLVSALGGIHISKIDGVGWMFGALSRDGDLYLWGRAKPGVEADMSGLLGDGQEEVKLLEGEEFENVLDFAVGNGHVVVNVADGVFAVGGNRNGQLGVGHDEDDFVHEWTKIRSFPEAKPIGLVAGDCSSFVVVET